MEIEVIVQYPIQHVDDSRSSDGTKGQPTRNPFVGVDIG